MYPEVSPPIGETGLRRKGQDIIRSTCFTYTACCIILLHNFLHGDSGETGDIANIATIAGANF